MNPFRWSVRAKFFLGFLMCVSLLGYALYAQYYGGLAPCPLCLLQRGALALLAAIFVSGSLHPPRTKWIRLVYSFLGAIAAGAGLAVAGRHVWLQHLPKDQVPACGPDLAYLMDTLPFVQVIDRVFTGSGECAQVDWLFAGLSMPEWSLIWFTVLMAWALCAGFKCSDRKVPAQ